MRLNNPIRKRGSAGDTIVEVMFALVILSSVIGVAFGAATRSLRQNQAAQERVEALKLIERQVEFMRLYRQANPNAGAYPAWIPSNLNGSCFNSAGSVVTDVGNCLVNADGSPSTNGRYTIKIIFPTAGPSNASQGKINYNITWQPSGTNRKDQINLYNRIW